MMDPDDQKFALWKPNDVEDNEIGKGREDEAVRAKNDQDPG
jgi:hypothetical protein